jgi:hypothetical protein
VDLPVPLHERQARSLSQWLTPFPPQTMQEILAPRGLIPVPLQKTHFFTGSSTSTLPLPLHTRQHDKAESKSNGSLPVPPQKAHFIIVDIFLKINVLNEE